MSCRLLVFGSLLVAVACGQEYELSSVEGPMAAAKPAPIRQKDAPEPALQLVTHTDTIELGADAPAEVADYLFVIDPSSSMDRVVDGVRAGIAALAADGVFPPDAHLAVMTTTPSDPANPMQPHPGVGKRFVAALDPGFMGLVDADRLERARLLPSPFGERFEHRGCGAWFTPSEVDPDGVPCLVAHTQLALASLHVEAGMTALAQVLERAPLFRPGAAVNVIFVSDTHDPGVPEARPGFEELMLLRPDAFELDELAQRRHPLASFRMHAIAPERKCSAESWDHLGPVYLLAAVDSGGIGLDVCEAAPADYVDLIRRIAVEGAVPERAVVPVREPGRVVDVLVDGVAAPFVVSGGAVVLDGALSPRRQRVEVRYRTIH